MLALDDRPKAEDALLQALRQNETIVLEPAFDGVQPETRFFEITAFPCFLPKSAPERLSLLIRDITKRRRREQIHHVRYRISRATLDLDACSLLTWVVDEAETITQSGIGFFHFVDRDQDQLRLQAWSTNTARTLRAAGGAEVLNDQGQSDVWLDCVREGLPVIRNDVSSEADGPAILQNFIEVRRVAMVPLLQDDKVVAVLGVGNKTIPYDDEDMVWLTELADLARETVACKLSEARLVETERYMARTLGHLPGMIFRISPDHTLLFASSGCRDLTGYGNEELVGDRVASFGSLIHPEDRAMLSKAIAEAAERNTPHQVVYRLQTRDGTLKWVWQQGRGLMQNGEMMAVEGFVYDITSQVEAQKQKEELEHKALAAQKMESLGVLAGGIAHDFNNLLQTMVGYLEMGQDLLMPDHPAREYLGEVGKAALRASTLTRQMLDFSGKGQMAIKVVDLNTQLRNLRDFLERALPAEVDVKWELAEGLPVIKVDLAQLQQVVLNLVTNAAEAVATRGGIVVIRTGSRHCTEEWLAKRMPAAEYSDPDPVPGPHVFLEVEDDGCGMTEEVRRRLCEPFFTTKFTGRGLGMAAVQGILRGHSGWLRVDSTPEQGSCVRVGFPAAPVLEQIAAIRPLADVASAPPSSEGGILVVDDEKHVRDLVCLTLRNQGLRVDCARDGREALKLFAADPGGYACVLLDLLMPFLDGRECLDRIREINKEQKVILMSGFSEENIRQRFEPNEVQGLLIKPFLREDLLEALPPVIGPWPQ